MQNRARSVRNRAEAVTYIKQLIVPLMERVGLAVEVEQLSKWFAADTLTLTIKLPRG